jgi:hypothetical protein
MSRRILSFALFEAKSGLNKEQIKFLNKYTNGTWTYDSSTGLVDVEGHFDCSNKKLEDFVGVKFGKVSGDFYCWKNNLTNLEGAPQDVGGNFSCWYNNELTSLAGAPQKVGGYFKCHWNLLKSLEGAPQEVGGDFQCDFNRLTSLEGAPQRVGGEFRCEYTNLTSLAGAPQEVGGEFNCSNNNLTSLAGAPQKVGGDFDCYKNNLTSLAGAPQEVGREFKCDAFKLKRGKWNLKGWLKVLQEGSTEDQKLISTILSAEELNKEIQKDPTGMIMKLREIWNDQNFKETRSKLVWPKGYGEEADLVGDLDDVGF